MSLPRFFLENQVLAAETEACSRCAWHSTTRSTRGCSGCGGEHIAVIDADQDYFECEIVDFAGRAAARVHARHEDASEAGPQVILLRAWPRATRWRPSSSLPPR